MDLFAETSPNLGQSMVGLNGDFNIKNATCCVLWLAEARHGRADDLKLANVFPARRYCLRNTRS